MTSVRRWYIMLVATISLQALAWAIIELLRNLLGYWGDRSNEALAFQVAVIVIALPVFLIHWLWAQRLAAASDEERGALLRRVYLFANMAFFLAAWAGSATDMVRGMLGLLLSPGSGWQGRSNFWASSDPVQGLLGDGVPLLVLGALWLYQRRVALADAAALPPIGNNALVRRVYLLAFSFGGLLATVQGMAATLRWVLFQIGGGAVVVGGQSLIDPLAAMLVGLPVWALHWRLAQMLFHGPNPEERESALRKFYLHAVVFLSALAAVSGATLVLNGLLLQAFGVPTPGDIRNVLPTVLITAVVWVYHSLILRADTALISEAPRQAGVRRLSWYLVASIGLAAGLIGLAGIVNALIRLVGAPTFGDDLREQVAWALSALIAGLPVWALIWRRAQGAAERDDPGGDAERGSLVRRIYMYGFLFAATLTILSSLIYIVYRLLSVLLGEPIVGGLVADLAQAIAFSGIAAAVLLYHGSILRNEGRRQATATAARVGALRVAVIDIGVGSFGHALIDRLRRDLPDLTIRLIDLTPTAADAIGVAVAPRDLGAQLAEADLIIGPWQIAVPQAGSPDLAQAVAASPARKLLLPAPAEGWDWVGVGPLGDDTAIDQIVQALRQIIGGEPVRLRRPMSALAILGAVFGVILLLIMLSIVLSIVGGLF